MFLSPVPGYRKVGVGPEGTAAPVLGVGAEAAQPQPHASRTSRVSQASRPARLVFGFWSVCRGFISSVSLALLR